jgi:hypothetical protein
MDFGGMFTSIEPSFFVMISWYLQGKIHQPVCRQDRIENVGDGHDDSVTRRDFQSISDEKHYQIHEVIRLIVKLHGKTKKSRSYIVYMMAHSTHGTQLNRSIPIKQQINRRTLRLPVHLRRMCPYEKIPFHLPSDILYDRTKNPLLEHSLHHERHRRV